MSDEQERWDFYAVAGTRERVRAAMRGEESLSAFMREAIDRELRRRKNRARRAAEARLVEVDA